MGTIDFAIGSFLGVLVGTIVTLIYQGIVRWREREKFMEMWYDVYHANSDYLRARIAECKAALETERKECARWQALAVAHESAKTIDEAFAFQLDEYTRRIAEIEATYGG